MLTGLDCYPCFLRQALEAARFSGLDKEGQKTVIREAMEILGNHPETATPPEIAHRINSRINQLANHPDPYQKVKQHWTTQALALLPRLEKLAAVKKDPLERALRIGVAGNVIDFAVAGEFDLETTLTRVLEAPFARDQRGEFFQAQAKAEWVLLLGDNAGETVFDRILIKGLAKRVVYAVKGGPIINDANEDDARQAGIDELAELVNSGSTIPGTLLSDVSAPFKELFNSAPLILAKGQAHYETLAGRGDRRVFFLLQVKCPMIAADLGGLEIGSIVLAQDGGA